MEWSNEMMLNYQQFGNHETDAEMQEVDNEDFYGDQTAVNGDAKPGAAAGEHEEGDLLSSLLPSSEPRKQQSKPEMMVNAEQQDSEAEAKHKAALENQRRAAILREKLLANKQNTPLRGSRANTPSKPAAMQQQQPQVTPSATKVELETNHDALGLDALFKEEMAAAAAKHTAKVAAAAEETEKKVQANGLTAPENKIAADAKPPTPNAQPTTDAQKDIATRPQHLTDPYYADLSAWLEMTGYHDLTYRNSKLRTYKERRALEASRRELEEEAARIAERLEKLKQEEQAEMDALRASSALPPSNSQTATAPPPLPAQMPTPDTVSLQAAGKKLLNGTKRPHSPSPAEKHSRRRADDASTVETPNGFRFRGVNDSPADSRPPTASRRPSSPKAIERRISYPDVRRRESDAAAAAVRSRDPSLERRQAYYKRDGERPPPLPMPYEAARHEMARYDHPPREPPRTPYNNRNANGYGSVGRVHTVGGGGGGGGYRSEYPPGPYRGSAGLDLGKGGVRYFILKSWNHENVATCQRDGLWATQTKNEPLLTHAFNTSRHVILLFSVNKSMNFQGYALMTSAPNPALPPPSFSQKLNWGTSPSFRVEWLGTTPVHFSRVGHLKNTMNVDEEGRARAVLVGKDGQEVSEDAGRGVVGVMDEAEVEAKGGDGRGW